MEPTPLSLDTAPEIERLQVEGWRRMSAEQKAATVAGLTQSVFDLARAGVRHRHPNASAHEQFLRRLDRHYWRRSAPILGVDDLLARALKEGTSPD